MTKAIYTYIPFDGEGDEEVRELKSRSGQTVDTKAWNNNFFATFQDGFNILTTEEELEFLPQHALKTINQVLNDGKSNSHRIIEFDEESAHSTYWDDLNDDLRDPTFKAAYELASKQIAEKDAARNSRPDCDAHSVLRWRDVKIGDRITIFNHYEGTPEFGRHTFVVDHPDDIRPDDLRLELLNIETSPDAITTEEWIEKHKPINWKKHYEDLKQRCIEADHLLTETLAPVLGYQRDPEYGLVIGDHTGESLALEAAAKIPELENEVEQYKEALSWESTHLSERTNQFDKAVEKIDKLNKKLIAITKVLDGESSV